MGTSLANGRTYAGLVRGMKTSPRLLGGVILLVAVVGTLIYLLLKPSPCEAWQDDMRAFQATNYGLTDEAYAEALADGNELIRLRPEGCPFPKMGESR